ncbi:P-loop containing nucleoside triphosphate hydrolase protein [Aspergillus spectabilis]
MTLQSQIVRYRLNQINQVRAQGIGDCISLPQIVVCGDQSSGKSSVLTGITGFAFPRKEGTSTRFATKILIRHSNDTVKKTACILPRLKRKDGSEGPLKAYMKEISSMEKDFPSVIEEVSRLMGVRGFSDDIDTPGFVADVLRIEIIGDTGLSLTVVDLPGLISSSDHDNGDDNVGIIDHLVNGYLETTRSIILAVVQASNNIQNQKVIQRARMFDRPGERTIGVITKPDMVNVGSEKRIARLANNVDSTKLKLGFFIVKNPEPELVQRGISIEEWKKKEQDFFHSGRYKDQGLDPDQVGVDCLRRHLETTLEEHIKQEIPNIFLVTFGIRSQRKYLLEMSMNYLALIRGALDSRYQEVNSSFFGNKPAQPSPNLPGSLIMPEPVWVSEEKFSAWVYRNTRGLELPGNYNHIFLSELFHEHFARRALDFLASDKRVGAEVLKIVNANLEENLQAAQDELRKICDDERGPPVTYNHYYTDTIQKSHQSKFKNLMKKLLNPAPGTGKGHQTSVTNEALAATLEDDIIFDIDKAACQEAIEALDAYYKLSMKTFVDNVCRQVLERHVLKKLEMGFHPTVGTLPDASITKLAAESPQPAAKRQELGTRIQALEKSLRLLSDEPASLS